MNILFDFIPKELLFCIFDYSDPQVLSTYSVLFEHLDMITYLRQRAYMNTGLNTNNYNLDQLIRICRLPEPNNIIAGVMRSYIITLEGNVYRFGQSELGSNTDSRLIHSFNDIIQISTGSDHTLMLNRDGQVYGLGSNKYSELGLINVKEAKQPIIIPGLNNIIQVTTGFNHSLALTADGEVYVFGNNTWNQIGINTNENEINIPTLLKLIPDIISISAGYHYSLLLGSNGKVYSIGYNNCEQLNMINYTEDNLSHTLIPDANDEPNYTEGVTLIANIDNIVQIFAGHVTSLLLKSDGQVYGFGYNLCSHIGLIPRYVEHPTLLKLIPNWNDIISLSLTDEHLLILNNKGEVYGFGSNSHGE